MPESSKYNPGLAENFARLDKHTRNEGLRVRSVSRLSTVFSNALNRLRFKTVVEVNSHHSPRCPAMARRPASDHIGRTPAEVHPDVASAVEPLLSRVIASGEAIVNVPISRTIENGTVSEQHFLASFFPMKGSDGGVDGVGVVVLETTERAAEGSVTVAEMEAAPSRRGVAPDFNKSHGSRATASCDRGYGCRRETQASEIHEALIARPPHATAFAFSRKDDHAARLA